ncbi:hypothetical protein AB0M68_33715 [Streptomyces sp. NPDC051453]|uniref:hypothetical protein n=1 Tax=Streptomyces sp. NPDC051453 TaxID=3154941 RepID=UPI003417A1F9
MATIVSGDDMFVIEGMSQGPTLVGVASAGVADVSDLCVVMTPSPFDLLSAGLWAPPPF